MEYFNKINWIDLVDKVDRIKDEKYNGKDKKRIKMLLGDNPRGIAFIYGIKKEVKKEVKKDEN